MAASDRVVPKGAAWDETLARFSASGQNDIYFDHRYVALYATGGAEVRGFVHEEDGEIFFLPHLKRAIPTKSGPLFDMETPYGYTGPLSTTVDRCFLKKAWAAFRDYCREERIVAAFLRFHPLLENHHYAEGGPVRVIAERKTVFLDLDQDEDAIWREYASDNRNRIRKAMKSGVTVTQRDDTAALKIFSDLYHAHMDELGADADYFFGEDYFNAIARLGRGRFRIYLAERKGAVIGGAVVLLSDRFAHYHLSSSLHDYFSYAPNNMLRHAVISGLLRQRWSRLHFGGGRGPDPKDSLFKFKRMFSKQEAQFYIGSFIADEAVYESLRSDWVRAHPEKVAAYGNRVLCYRYR